MTRVVSKSLCEDRGSECQDENGPRHGLNPEAPSIKARATWDTWAGAPLYAAPISLYHTTTGLLPAACFIRLFGRATTTTGRPPGQSLKKGLSDHQDEETGWL